MHDSHCHLTTLPLYDYREQAIDNFVKKGGEYILNTSSVIENSYKVIEIAKEFKHKYPNLLQNTIGIHPQEYISKDIFSDQYDILKRNMKELKKIFEENKQDIHGIGECGLEYHNLLNSNEFNFKEKEKIIEVQKMSFREHINIAIENNLPMTIHVRDEFNSNYCATDILNILVSEGKMQLKGCMHCYVGEEKLLHDFLDLGLYIGFNAILTYKSGENVRELLKKTPIEKILIETDAPFLPLNRVRKDKKEVIRFGQPKDVFEIAEVISEIKKIKVEEVLERTTENYKSLFLKNI